MSPFAFVKQGNHWLLVFESLTSSDWFQHLDQYCERTNASFWSEPFNALSNVGFLIAAIASYILWYRSPGRTRTTLFLIATVALIAIGSFLNHTFANHLTLLMDVLPITLFIYAYFFLAIRRFAGLSIALSGTVTSAFALFSLGFERIWFGLLGPETTLNGSIGYVPSAIAMLGLGVVFYNQERMEAARGLFTALGLFIVSLILRMMDLAVCPAFPVGTHLFWHLLNALVLFVLMQVAIRVDADRYTLEHAPLRTESALAR